VHARRRLLGGVLALLLLGPGLEAVAHASAKVVAAPGWYESSEATPEARRRAQRWADALGMRMVQVLSTDDDDRYAETIAVFEHAEPVRAERFADEAKALATLATMVEGLVGTQPPEQAGMRETASGHAIAWGQWIVDDVTYECVLAPSGASASLVVASMLTSERASARAELDAVYAELEGATDAVPAFSPTGWRLGGVGLWVVLALALHGVMLRFTDRERDHRQAGLRAAGIVALLVVIGTLVARSLLVQRELALQVANTSVGSMLGWIGVAGLSVVGLHVLLAQRADSGLVQSAPATGAFASGTYSTADMVRSTIQKAALRDAAASSGAWARTRRPPGAGRNHDTDESHLHVVDDDDERPL
jgi:hypothetical protein